MYGLYIHIPFCRRKCRYCDFVSETCLERTGEYVNALAIHMRSYCGRAVSTVYIGGGTPTLLSPEEIRRLFSAIRETFDCGALTEVTYEANPESLTDEVLEALAACGVNRLSIGAQSFSDVELGFLGRIHTADDFDRACRLARSRGFGNLNIDLIYGLPSQTPADWERTLERALSYESEHLSLYPLTVEPGTPLHTDGVTTDDDLQARVYEYSLDVLRKAGYEHYEISNWAKPGRESQHNLTYWRNKEYVGIGESAASYLGGIRSVNRRDMEMYLRAVREGKDTAEESERIDASRKLSEEIILNLRCSAGLEVSGRITDVYGGTIDELVSQELLERTGSRMRLSRKGMLLANQVMHRFV